MKSNLMNSGMSTRSAPAVKGFDVNKIDVDVELNGLHGLRHLTATDEEL